MSHDTRIDRSDILRLVREQASRVYLQTIAANEREDRLLNKKLNAIDLEHRAQYLKMKKWIHDANKCSKRKAKKVESYHICDSEASHEHARLRAAKMGSEKSTDTKTNDTLDRHVTCQPKTNKLGLKNNVQSLPGLTNRRTSVLLTDRVKYTSSEVARLKTSFAGKKTPPPLRRGRTFLPHLEAAESQCSVPDKPQKGKNKKRNVLAKKMNTLDSMDDKLPQIVIGTTESSFDGHLILRPPETE